MYVGKRCKTSETEKLPPCRRRCKQDERKPRDAVKPLERRVVRKKPSSSGVGVIPHRVWYLSQITQTEVSIIFVSGRRRRKCLKDFPLGKRYVEKVCTARRRTGRSRGLTGPPKNVSKEPVDRKQCPASQGGKRMVKRRIDADVFVVKSGARQDEPAD